MSQTKVKSGLLNFPDQTDFVKLPSGTTAQRPSSPEKGYSRYNTTDNKLEYWNGTEWQQLPSAIPPIITSISYPGDDLAADPAGGQTITINGGDFKAGATVTVDGTTPSVITFVSAAEITFTAPAKTAGDYDIVVTNVDGGNATAVDAMTYNGLPSWTTPAGNLGTFAAGSTIPTITLVATEPDSGVVSYSVTTGALPSGLTLSGADIDGAVPFPAGETTYNFSVTASDDENQESTERAFNIVVYLQVTNTVSEVDPFGDSSGVALYKLEPTSNVGSHRYWRYTVGSSTNHHPRVSRIYLVKSDGSKENFASFTSDNCSDSGTIPTQGTVYDIDLGSDDEAIGSGFYVTFGDGERNINYTLSYSDDNANWNIASSNYVNANACGEWNNAIQIAKDESDNYNGATASVGYKTGVFGQAGVFNGSTSSYIYRNPDFLPYGNSPRAFSFWVKLDSHVEDAYFLSYGDGVSGQFFSPRITPTSQGGYISFMGYAVDYSTNVVMTTNEWMNLCYSYDGSVMSIYKNGALIGSSSLSLNTTNVRDFIVGARDYNGSITKPIDGSMDQLRVFNRAITPLEVESLYRERTVVCGGQADTLDILGDNSCVATYQLNGNANDLSGNYSGTPTNVSYGVGEFDLAGVFNGSSSYVTIGDYNVFSPVVNDLSVSLWFNTSVASGTKWLATKGAASNYEWAIYATSNGVVGCTMWQFGGSNCAFVFSPDNSYSINTWHNFVVSMDYLGSLSIYLDGQLMDSTTTFTGTMINGSAPVLIGKRADQSIDMMNGSIDQVRIFNKALNSTEVTTLYNETACDALACSGTTNTLDILSDGSCIAAYPLDGSPADLSGNYNGVLVGTGSFRSGKFDLSYANNNTSGISCPSFGISGSSAIFSASMWVKFGTVSGSEEFIMLTGSNSTNSAYVLARNSSGIYIDAYGVAHFFPSSIINDTNWHHIVGVSNGSNHKLYIDGSYVSEINQSLNFVDNFRAIGGRSIDNSTIYPAALQGEIDQVRIFNKALSASEVTTLYNETACN